MEEPRNQQLPGSGQPIAPAGYGVPQAPYPYYPPTPVARPGFFGMFGRVLRLMLRRLLYVGVLGGRMLRPVLPVLLVAFPLLAIMGWMGWQLWGPRADAPTFSRVDSIAPAPAVLNYLQGRKSFDADLMWDAFSTEYQTSQLNLGASKATLQSQANTEKTMGLTYNRSDYVGGVELDDGGALYFYTVTVSMQSQSAKAPMVFTTNKEGRIENIISPLDRLTRSTTR